MYPPRSQSPGSVPQPQRSAGRRRNVPHVLRFCEMSAFPCLPHVKTESNLGRAQGGISLRVKAKRASAYTDCQSTSDHLAKSGSYQQDLPCISILTDSTPLLMLSQPQLLTLFAGGLGPSVEPLSLSRRRDTCTLVIRVSKGEACFSRCRAAGPLYYARIEGLVSATDVTSRMEVCVCVCLAEHRRHGSSRQQITRKRFRDAAHTHTQAQRKGQVKQHRRNKGPSWLRPALFCLGTSSYAGVVWAVGRGKRAHVGTGDLALFARNPNILPILPGFGPVAIHPHASPDAHLCCGSTLHTMTGARARLSPSSFHPHPPLLLLPAAVSLLSRFFGCV